MATNWTVIKVGGSLYDWPELRGRLRAYLRQFDGGKVLLVPGGGATAQAIRAFDRTHQLGEEASHWLAIAALSVNRRFLQMLLPEARPVDPLACAAGLNAFGCAGGLYVLDPLPFFQADEQRADHLPHAWQVTSDSLAVRAALLLNAPALILLKSASWDGNDWSAARRAGMVDGYFETALRQAPADLIVRLVNLRLFT